MSLEMRASDEDRGRVIAALHRHTAAGRLSLDEFSDRLGAVYAARTLGDLAIVTRDLPAVPTPAPVEHVRRDLLVIFAVAAIALVLLGVFMAVTR